MRALIVAAIVGLFLGPCLVLGRAEIERGCESKLQIAKLTVEQIRHDYARWALAHPDRACPTLLEITRYMGKDEQDLIDPWGGRYALTCTPRRLEVRSSGEDRLFGTADDIHVP